MPTDQIHIDSFMLADGARTFDGKIIFLGGGWNFLNILEPEAPRPMTIAGRAIVTWASVDQELTLVISLDHFEGEVVLESARIVQITLQPQIRPDQPAAVETATPFAFDIPGIIFFHPGEYAFVIAHDGKELARTRFQVNFAISEPQTPIADEEASTIGS